MKTLKIGNLLARIPIVQGGMGVGVSLSGLASAVASEGGIGVISSAGLGAIYHDYSSDYDKASIWGLREELRKARERTRGIIGVNVMVAMSNFADMVRTAVAEKADIIFSGAGLPLNLPSFLTEGSRTKLAPIVSSARAARLLCEKWFGNYGYIPDAVVVEGPKAGGHLGYKEEQIGDAHYALETLVPQIVAEVRDFEAAHGCHIPVIAAGGIYTGEDIYRIMEWGPTACRWAPASSPPTNVTPTRLSSRATSTPPNRTSRSSAARSACPDGPSATRSSTGCATDSNAPKTARSTASERAT